MARWAPPIRPALEALMYLAFCAAALPFAWLGVTDLLYYRAHPDLLETRDAAPAVLAVVGALEITEYALGVAAILSLYFLIRGPRAVRISSAILVIAWILVPAFCLFFVPTTAFTSTARLVSDAAPFVALLLLPWACAGGRFMLAMHEKNNSDTADART